MTLTSRRILFAFFVAAFVIAGVIVIYYTRGYRFDLSTFSITKTGAVYVEAQQSGIEILLGKNIYSDKSGLLKKGTLISNVIPKKYTLTIKKDGYFDYQKNIEVLPSQVTRIFNIYLVPKEIKPSLALKNLKGDVIIDVSSDGRMLAQDTQKGTYYLYNLSDNPVSPINFSSKISALTRQKILAVWFYPQTDTFIIKTQKGVYRTDLNAKTVTAIQEGAIGAVEIDGNNLYAVIQNQTVKTKTSPASSVALSKISVFDLVLNSKVSEFSLPYESSQIKAVDVAGGLTSLLLSDGSLYLYDSSGKQTLQIAHSAKRMAVSDDKSKIFFQDNDGKTFVYLFNEELMTLDAGKDSTLRLMLVDTAHIENAWWFPDSFHLLLQYPDKITLAEVTSKDPNENFLILNSQQGNAFYSPARKTFYVLNTGNLTGIDANAL